MSACSAPTGAAQEGDLHEKDEVFHCAGDAQRAFLRLQLGSDHQTEETLRKRAVEELTQILETTSEYGPEITTAPVRF